MADLDRSISATSIQTWWRTAADLGDLDDGLGTGSRRLLDQAPGRCPLIPSGNRGRPRPLSGRGRRCRMDPSPSEMAGGLTAGAVRGQIPVTAHQFMASTAASRWGRTSVELPEDTFEGHEDGPAEAASGTDLELTSLAPGAVLGSRQPVIGLLV
jgi:hypothetical protein